MDQLYQYALNSKNEKLCLDILRVRITDNPYDLTFLGQGGEFAEIRKEYPLAIFFYTRSFRLYPTVQTAQNLVAIHLRLDQPDRLFLTLNIYSETEIRNLTDSKSFAIRSSSTNKN